MQIITFTFQVCGTDIMGCSLPHLRSKMQGEGGKKERKKKKRGKHGEKRRARVGKRKKERREREREGGREWRERGRNEGLVKLLLEGAYFRLHIYM